MAETATLLDERAAGLLDGAVDLHRHGFPEISEGIRTSLSDVDDITLCREAGMAAVVLKSHVWPTPGRAHLLEQLVPGIRVVASVTLNEFAGGMRPEVVELAARQGAGVVYLPTASAHNDLVRGGISQRISAEIDSYVPDPERGVRVLDADGNLTPETWAVLEALETWPMTVYSGHLSAEETLAIARTGRLADRLVLSHPDSDSIEATDEAIQEAAALGAFIEITALGTYPQIGRVDHAGLARTVRLVGASRCVLTSDYFFPWAPPSHQMLLDLALGLMDHGITRHEIRTMLCDNPASLV